MTWIRRLVLAFERIASALEEANRLSAESTAMSHGLSDQLLGRLDHMPGMGAPPVKRAEIVALVGDGAPEPSFPPSPTGPEGV